jgi:hypothetical protein
MAKISSMLFQLGVLLIACSILFFSLPAFSKNIFLQPRSNAVIMRTFVVLITIGIGTYIILSTYFPGAPFVFLCVVLLTLAMGIFSAFYLRKKLIEGGKTQRPKE